MKVANPVQQLHCIVCFINCKTNILFKSWVKICLWNHLFRWLNKIFNSIIFRWHINGFFPFNSNKIFSKHCKKLEWIFPYRRLENKNYSPSPLKLKMCWSQYPEHLQYSESWETLQSLTFKSLYLFFLCVFKSLE